MTDQQGRVGEDASDPRTAADRSEQEEIDRVRREALEAGLAVDRAGDEALDDYERRRKRLADDLTGELPNDSPEPE